MKYAVVVLAGMACAMATWEGWMDHLPAAPSCRARTHSVRK